tara:strand:- start:1130 stop:1309 length:180 start_codon:yes stop_codon:yes gene_type:complete
MVILGTIPTPQVDGVMILMIHPTHMIVIGMQIIVQFLQVIVRSMEQHVNNGVIVARWKE